MQPPRVLTNLRQPSLGSARGPNRVWGGRPYRKLECRNWVALLTSCHFFSFSPALSYSTRCTSCVADGLHVTARLHTRHISLAGAWPIEAALLLKSPTYTKYTESESSRKDRRKKGNKFLTRLGRGGLAVSSGCNRGRAREEGCLEAVVYACVKVAQPVSNLVVVWRIKNTLS